MTDKMKAYLRENVRTGLEMMIRDNSNGHVFDLDSERVFVFVMAVVPRHEFEKVQRFTTSTEPLACEHQWNGPRILIGQHASVGTCSKCGASAVPELGAEYLEPTGDRRTSEDPATPK